MKQLVFLFVLIFSLSACSQNLPEGFSYLSDIDSTIESELRYITHDNFLGKPVDGYEKNVVIISTLAAEALKELALLKAKEINGNSANINYVLLHKKIAGKSNATAAHLTSLPVQQ